MKRRMICFALCLVMVIGMLPQFAFAATGGSCGANVKWSLNNGVITITGSGDMYDYDWENLPPWNDRMEEITTVVIGEGVTSVGDCAFVLAHNLESVTLSNTVKRLGWEAFMAPIETLAIPASLTEIDSYALAYCNNFTEITVAAGNPAYTAVDGSLYNKSMTALIRYASGRDVRSFSVPSGVLELYGNAFNSSYSLVEVHIPASVRLIGEEQFVNCSNLVSIEVDSANTKFCSVDGVLFTEDKTTLVAFPQGREVQAYVVPSGVTEIGDHAFLCSKIESITLPEGLERIGFSTFGAVQFESISIPESVTFIGTQALDGVLSDVYYGGTQEAWNAAIADSWNVVSDDVTVHFGDGTSISGGNSGGGGSGGGGGGNEDLPTSGSCGDNLEWFLDGEVLVIEGTGDMYNYSRYADENPAPWKAFAEDIYLVEITYGATSIGSYAFSDCVNLNSISYPDSVTEIGDGAFIYSGLEGMYIPWSVTSIGDSAFGLCENLVEFTVAGGNNAYTAVDGHLYTKNMTTLLQYAVGQTQSSFAVPNGVRRIGDNAFNMAYYLTEITLPASLQKIGYNAVFTNCTALENIHVSSANTTFASVDGVLFSKDKTRLERYPQGRSETAYTVPSGVTTIGVEAFMDAQITDVILPDTLVTIEAAAFYDSALESVTIPKSVEFIDIEGLVSAALTDVYYEGTEAEWNKVCGDPYWVVPEGTHVHFGSTGGGSSSGGEEKNRCGDNAYWTLVDGVLTVSGKGPMYDYGAASAPWYEQRTSIDSVVIEDGVTSVGDYAFNGCSALEEITFLDSVEVIGERAFEDCLSLRSVTIPDSVTELGKYAFSGCGFLTTVVIGSGITRIEDGAFSECNCLSDVTIPDSVEVIGYYAFAKCPSLAVIDIPSSVTTIGDSAFKMCKGLVEVNLPEGVETLGIEVFYYCPALESVRIPASVETIGDDSFYRCTALVEIVVDENNKNYTSKNGVLFTEDMTELVAYPAGLSGAYTVPQDVETINRTAFYLCEGLTEISIPESVKTVEFMAFEGCSNLTDVYYEGTSAEWSAIKIESSNNAFKNADKHYGEYKIFGDETTDQVTWAIDDTGTLTISGKGPMKDYSFLGDDGELVKRIVIEEGVTRIGHYVFEDCVNASEISIPASVTEIGSDPFNCGNQLKNITVADGNPVFCDVDGVVYTKDMTELVRYPKGKTWEEYQIPSSVTTLRDEAFWNCNNLIFVNIPASVTKIGDRALSACFGLSMIMVSEENPNYCTMDGMLMSKDKTVLMQYLVGRQNSYYKIPDGVTEIGDSAFLGCNNLDEVKISEGVTTIGWSAFDGCSNLRVIHIPQSVTTIEPYAFYFCTGLSDVYYGGSPRQWRGIVIGEDNETLKNAKMHYAQEDTELLGDVNLDGVVDVTDAVLLFQYSMLPDIYPIEYTGSVDFNKDGVVDVNDAVLLFQYSMLPDLYPIG